MLTFIEFSKSKKQSTVNYIFKSALHKKFPYAIYLLDALGSAIDDLKIPQPYRDELKGIAETMRLPVGDALFVNLVYEFTAYDTTRKRKQSKTHHNLTFCYWLKLLHGNCGRSRGRSDDARPQFRLRFCRLLAEHHLCGSLLPQQHRTLAYSLKQCHKKHKSINIGLIVLCVFQLLYTSAQIAGFTGILTGHKHRAFTLSLNQRSKFEMRSTCIRQKLYLI